MSPNKRERDHDGGRRGGGGRGGQRGGQDHSQRRNSANGPSPRNERHGQAQGNKSNSSGRRGIMKNTHTAPVGFEMVSGTLPLSTRNPFATNLNNVVRPRTARSSMVTCITALSTQVGGSGCYRCARTNRKLRDFLVDLFEGGRRAVDEWAEAAGVSAENHMEWERTKTRTLAGGLRRGSEPCDWCCMGTAQGGGGVYGGGVNAAASDAAGFPSSEGSLVARNPFDTAAVDAVGGIEAATSSVVPSHDQFGMSYPEQAAAHARRAGYRDYMLQDPSHAVRQPHANVFGAQQQFSGAPVSAPDSNEAEPTTPRMAPSSNPFLTAVPTRPDEMAIATFLNPPVTTGPVHSVDTGSVGMNDLTVYQAAVSIVDIAQAQQEQWAKVQQHQPSSQFGSPD